MGNRATVIFTDEKEEQISCAVYLHWNGGPESIYGFLAELDRRFVHNDQDYECARFIKLVGDFFDQDKIGTTSLGVVNGPKAITVEELGKVRTYHGDNGFYIVCRTTTPDEKKFTTRMRRFHEHYEKDPGSKDGYKCSMQEMTPDEVAREKRVARRHQYAKNFRERFKEIQGKREIERN